MNRIACRFSLLWISFLILSGNLSGADNEVFENLELNIPGKVQLCLPYDLNSDGKAEAVVVYKKGEYPGEEVFISAWEFSKSDEGAIKSQELFNFAVDKKISAFTLGRRGPDRKTPSFFGLSRDGVYSFGVNGKGYYLDQLINIDTLFGLQERGNIVYFDFVRDFNGDGTDEIIVPVKNGMALYSLGSQNKYAEETVLPVAANYFYRSSLGDLPFEMKYSVRGSFWIPQILSLDFNNDGFKDIVFLWQDEIKVFYGNREGKFAPERADNFFFNDLSPQDRDDRNSYVIYFIDDLNGDGLPDLVKNKFKGAFTSLKTETQITFRDNPAKVSGKVLLIKPGGSIGQGGIVRDVSGDGRKDLITASSSFGLLSIIKALLRGKIDIKFSFYIFNDKSYYGKDPDYSRTLTFGFNLKNAEVEGFLPSLDGDFNGDGYPDALYAPNDDEVKVILNNGKGRFDLDETRKYKTRVSGEFGVRDFDGDGKSDLCFFYKKGESRNKVGFLFSRL